MNAICISQLLPPTQLLSHKEKRCFESRTHVISVGTFVDLPKETFTKNAIKNYVFTGNTILWT